MRITIGGNWSFEDQLGNVTLKDGERVSLRWPDGSTSTYAVIAKRTTEEIDDMGHAYPAPVIQAFVVLEYRGAAVHVRIKDINVDVARSDQ